MGLVCWFVILLSLKATKYNYSKEKEVRNMRETFQNSAMDNTTPPGPEKEEKCFFFFFFLLKKIRYIGRVDVKKDS